MKTLLLVALGGAFGSMARFAVGKASTALWGVDFPWGTMIVNICGCFIMGVLAGLLSHFASASHDLRAFLLIGVLGGFTTFSAFAFDIFSLYERGFTGTAAFYLGVSVAASILAVGAGLFIVRGLST